MQKYSTRTIPVEPYEEQNTAVFNADFETVWNAVASLVDILNDELSERKVLKESSSIELKLILRDAENFIDCGKFRTENFGEERYLSNLSSMLVYSDLREEQPMAVRIRIDLNRETDGRIKVEVNCSYSIHVISTVPMTKSYYEYETRYRNEYRMINNEMVYVTVPYTEKITKFKDVTVRELSVIEAFTHYDEKKECQSNQHLEKKILGLIESAINDMQSNDAKI